MANWTVVNGFVSLNVKWQIKSDDQLFHISFAQSTHIPQLFYIWDINYFRRNELYWGKRRDSGHYHDDISLRFVASIHFQNGNKKDLDSLRNI